MSKIIHGILYVALISIIGYLAYGRIVSVPTQSASVNASKQILSKNTEYFTNIISRADGTSTTTRLILLPEEPGTHEEYFVDDKTIVSEADFEKMVKDSSQQPFFFKLWPKITVLDTQLAPSQIDPDCEYMCRPSNVHRLDYYYMDYITLPEDRRSSQVYKKIYSRQGDFKDIIKITYVPLSNVWYPSNVETVVFLESAVGNEMGDIHGFIENRLIEYDPITGAVVVRQIRDYNDKK